MKMPKGKKGFSLTELMIVVAVIGILAAVTVPAYFNKVKKARQDTAKANLLDMKSAQEMFYSLNNRYAVNIAGTVKSFLNFSPADTTYYVYRITAASATSFNSCCRGKKDGDIWRISGTIQESLPGATGSCP
ncbi:MAG: hypothetical protein A2521_10515 [Deltaproteobacteria bacterium RIFOXYD12_FULL_57_12]|nr:MAG: hypothetical protein A2521_10515 [Deltaproteobacteria bacterium RIFOXYD12_FULL_57_12]